ncbi:hypothetical protein LCGC14_2249930 [marine sediment metagenome]|uniref:Uncharacterized protein n=1 Tax=marine sediment metagenome TaxID=412755 RepID=A0A0F9FXW8_9ZZZZ
MIKYATISLVLILLLLGFVVYRLQNQPDSRYKAFINEEIAIKKEMLALHKGQIEAMKEMVSYFDGRIDFLESIVKEHSDYIGGKIVKNKVEK